MSVLLDIKCGDPESAAARYQLSGYAQAYRASTDAVTFEAAGHVYRTNDDGAIVPSVTQILRETGVSVDFEEIGGFGAGVKAAIELKRDIGVQVHAAAHFYDDNDLDLETLDPQVRPYLDAWATFRANYPHLHPATRERLVYHPGYRYAGTLDGIFFVGSETVIDITERWSVQLVPGRKVPYRVTPYNENTHMDDMVWQSIVTTYWAQAPRRKAA
jgi:hypothetical protein